MPSLDRMQARCRGPVSESCRSRRFGFHLQRKATRWCVHDDEPRRANIAPRTAGGCALAIIPVANETWLDRREMSEQRLIPIMAGTSNDRTVYDMNPDLLTLYRIAIAPALATMVLAGCGSAKPATTTPPPQVSVATVHR